MTLKEQVIELVNQADEATLEQVLQLLQELQKPQQSQKLSLLEFFSQLEDLDEDFPEIDDKLPEPIEIIAAKPDYRCGTPKRP